MTGIRLPASAFLALLSGAPGLVYQVVWTREVALLAGSQIEAISLVLVAFFGGLALGSRLFGGVADRARSPLRLYGALELVAGLLGAASPLALRALGPDALALPPGLALIAGCGLVIGPITLAYGGTLPALLRAVTSDPRRAASGAGVLVGANTLGAVGGVAMAVWAIPEHGLLATAAGAGLAAASVGCIALAFGRPGESAAPAAPAALAAEPGVLAWAALAGVATLGYEVLTARLATLRLGSSLYAWALVLGLFLAGLALGNLLAARRARLSERPALDLGWLEVAAACLLVLGVFVVRPLLTVPATGLTAQAVATVVAGVLPAAIAMGAAFPFFVRLRAGAGPLGAAFGGVSAINTAGGVAGALLAPYVLLPALGSARAALALAALDAGIGLWLLGRPAAERRGTRPLLAVAWLALACAPGLLLRSGGAAPWILFVEEGRQATAVVVQTGDRRDLVVDGDPEASTGGDARQTEELLAVLPLLLHPEPRSFLEVGLGSGITLATASRFSLDRLECVEIAGSVIRAAPYFAPDNTPRAGAGDLPIVHADARVLLAQRSGRYDVISANTLHPWSVGATGLYSRQYFQRLAGALTPSGVAVQWLPAAQIGSESMERILRTFFAVFPEGGLWWGAGNVIAVGSRAPLDPPEAGRAGRRLRAAGLSWDAIGLEGADALRGRRIATAQAVRRELGAGPMLDDDRPALEKLAARPRQRTGEAELFGLLVRLAQSGSRDSSAATNRPGDASQAGVLLWLESLEARALGDVARADARERLAAAAGFREADRAHARRLATEAHRAFAAGQTADAARGFHQALEFDPRQRLARFGLAGLATHRGDPDGALAALDRLLAQHPDDAQAWNERAAIELKRGDRGSADRSIGRALEANPFYLEALANAGLFAVADGDRPRALEMLARLRAASPLGVSAEEGALTEALTARSP